MKNNPYKFLKSLSIASLLVVISSCNNTPSIERYIVENENTPGFDYTVIPSSILDVSNVENPRSSKNKNEEGLSLLKDIGSVYVLTFNEAMADSSTTRGDKLKELKITLPETKYKDLLEFNVGGVSTNIKFRGEKSIAKELILLHDNPKENEFIVARIAGNIDIKKFVKASSKMDMSNFSELKEFFEKGGMDYLERKADAEYNEQEGVNL